jgi:acyl-CoA synthetase (AMP-forming)/AMP-acid ligase II
MSASGQVIVESVRPGSVVVRGALVALSDIEAQAREVQGVDDVAVLARVDERGHTRVIAYVVAQSGVAPSAIAQELACATPALLQPSDVVPVLRLPLTAAGAVDAGALRSWTSPC